MGEAAAGAEEHGGPGVDAETMAPDGLAVRLGDAPEGDIDGGRQTESVLDPFAESRRDAAELDYRIGQLLARPQQRQMLGLLAHSSGDTSQEASAEGEAHRARAPAGTVAIEEAEQPDLTPAGHQLARHLKRHPAAETVPDEEVRALGLARQDRAEVRRRHRLDGRVRRLYAVQAAGLEPIDGLLGTELPRQLVEAQHGPQVAGHAEERRTVPGGPQGDERAGR
ncbi:MAG TPA: hypothetical protein VIE41_16680, partial [Methylomirabilota bacterium]